MSEESLNNMIKKFERIDRKIVRKSNILTYCDDTLKLPDGRTVVYDTMVHNGAAAVIAVTDEGKIVMVRQYRHTFDRITLEIPAGGRNGDEEYIDAAIRELREEAGYNCSEIEYFMTIDTAIAYCDEKIEVFLAKGLTKTKQDLDPDEFIEVEEYELDDLMGRIFKGEIMDSKTVSAIMTYYGFQCKMTHLI